MKFLQNLSKKGYISYWASDNQKVLFKEKLELINVLIKDWGAEVGLSDSYMLNL
jgi:hypothetical protein